MKLKKKIIIQVKTILKNINDTIPHIDIIIESYFLNDFKKDK